MTRADQWAHAGQAVIAVAAVALITALATVEALRIGPAAAGLLYLLPVLWASAQAGLHAGLASAIVAAFCYNFFLLEPRLTLRIHGVADVAAFAVLVIVAAVTSRLASGLRARELEARDRADASAAEAEFAALLFRADRRAALDAAALAFLGERFGEARLVRGRDLLAGRTTLPPLDAAAAAWALHNGTPAGHATEVIAAADFRFVPLARGGDDVLALAADDREARADPAALARLWVQARDRLAAEAERQAREEAEQRERVRRALLAALGHDFRTPLTILKSGLAEMPGEAAALLAREVDRIVRLSEDLITAARLESGQPARPEPVDLVDIVAATAAPPAAAGIVLRHDLPADLPLVRADPVMLTHIVGNLVDNAVRHARTEVAIAARVVDDGVELSVVDDGEGIDPALADGIFERFVSGGDRAGGSGLGLAIARDLAHAMGTTLTAANEAGGGACFALRLAAFQMHGSDG